MLLLIFSLSTLLDWFFTLVFLGLAAINDTAFERRDPFYMLVYSFSCSQLCALIFSVIRYRNELITEEENDQHQIRTRVNEKMLKIPFGFQVVNYFFFLSTLPWADYVSNGLYLFSVYVMQAFYWCIIGGVLGYCVKESNQPMQQQNPNVEIEMANIQMLKDDEKFQQSMIDLKKHLKNHTTNTAVNCNICLHEVCMYKCNTCTEGKFCETCLEQYIYEEAKKNIVGFVLTDVKCPVCRQKFMLVHIDHEGTSIHSTNIERSNEDEEETSRLNSCTAITIQVEQSHA